jgi:hypothetical protein
MDKQQKTDANEAARQHDMMDPEAAAAELRQRIDRSRELLANFESSISQKPKAILNRRGN